MNENAIYLMFEMGYIDQMKKKQEFSLLNEWQCRNTLFPSGWFENHDIVTKLDFLFRAMDQDIPLTQIEGISVFNEGVRYK